MPCIKKLKDELAAHNVPKETIEKIYQGYEELTDKCAKKAKYEFFAKAMERMDALLDAETRNNLLSDCACCLGGKRAQNVQQFTKSIEGKNMTLAEKVEALKQSGLYGSPEILADGTISDGVYYADGNGGFQCACPNFHKEKRKVPISLTYCYCCAGHFRHHLQKALGVKLKPRVISSPLASMGEAPCRFVFEAVGE